ncbi:hypothetical protein TrLO_g13640 [Triparma laevis f. longispina]|uniref:Uncharacterized protein n=1 Tax=Triparma laevis f. longispina TaxID=1714387 RepID=A0A9W7A3W5_9STRA|nr:hypothetical protein TrLO_g13640 [Triparma laevis f. longispina]
MTLPNPHSTDKKFMLIISKGTIVLRGLQFGHTLLTFSAQVDVGEGRNDGAIDGSQSTRATRLMLTLKTRLERRLAASNKGTKKKKKLGGGGGVGGEAGELFCEIGALLYKRFKKEAIIDERRTKDFIKNIDNVPALTQGELNLIAGSMKLVEEVSSRMKKIAGTANEPVEKFLYHSEKGGAAVAMSVAKMDVTDFSRLG